MKYMLKVVWAYIRCYLYMIFYGKWKGHFIFEAHHPLGRKRGVVYVAAGKGTKSKLQFKVQKVFLDLIGEAKERHDPDCRRCMYSPGSIECHDSPHCPLKTHRDLENIGKKL